MIDKTLVEQAVDAALASREGIFPVSVKVSGDNRIVVEIDSYDGLDIDTVAAISRDIEERLNRDDEDFELEVGSAGLTSPFKVRGQYEKNLGNEVEALLRDGRKLSGILTAAGETEFTLELQRKVKPEGAKRPVLETYSENIPYSEAKSVKYVINFK